MGVRSGFDGKPMRAIRAGMVGGRILPGFGSYLQLLEAREHPAS